MSSSAGSTGSSFVAVFMADALRFDAMVCAGASRRELFTLVGNGYLPSEFSLEAEDLERPSAQTDWLFGVNWMTSMDDARDDNSGGQQDQPELAWAFRC